MERLRERRQFSLDDRQAVALAICALLLLSGVFSLGVLIGKRTAPAIDSGAGGLAALDAAARTASPHAEPAKAVAPPVAAATPLPQPPAEKPEPVRAATVIPAPPRPSVVAAAPSRPVPVAAAPPAALAPPPRDLGAFTVQVGASQDRAEAARLQNRVRGSGLRPYVVEARLGAKGTWYRIRVGAFQDRESAMRFRKDVERELRTVAVVMPTR